MGVTTEGSKTMRSIVGSDSPGSHLSCAAFLLAAMTASRRVQLSFVATSSASVVTVIVAARVGPEAASRRIVADRTDRCQTLMALPPMCSYMELLYHPISGSVHGGTGLRASGSGTGGRPRRRSEAASPASG